MLHGYTFSYQIPVTAALKFKRRLYFIHEPFFNFWFRFIYSNRIDLEANRQNEVLTVIKKDFSAYCGLMFEVLVTELIMRKQILRDHPFKDRAMVAQGQGDRRCCLE